MKKELCQSQFGHPVKKEGQDEIRNEFHSS